jgi:hypothetical protein
VLFAKYNYNDQVKRDGTGRRCSMHRGKMNPYKILMGKLEKRDHGEDTETGWRIILKWILER